ncbi:dTDP-4-dehydrorhamnose reductase [Litoreibacter halocynthiae]|uniref:dTDP-4-dehydrorhamnose reductase n=1 Tax=Litoreibacter halocynthiae TaxID=1242689 RepID=UPI002491A084|nr:dTDP-4-dehydrorhamnose reductase [Litoreibacter halocynthiae]
MRVLVFGATGQVALELSRFDGVTTLGRTEADLSDPAACAAAIRHHAPDAVINAAAYTAVDRCEQEEAAATVINGQAPAVMARACAELSIPFVHISTDYVFDGQGTTPMSPDDPVAPLNAYGRSKLAGEEGVAGADGQYCILRTSWVVSAHGSNFVKTMLRLSETRDAISVVSDQIGGPTAARSIAQACMTVAKVLRDKGAACSGIYHFSGAPDASWADLARAVFELANRPVTVTDISTADYPTPAARPLNSRLDCATLEKVFSIARPNWRQDVADIVQELGARADNEQ